jgi:hypothetical protein
MTDVVEKLVGKNRLPDRLSIPNCRLYSINLRNQPPNNPKKGKDDDIVQHTMISTFREGYTRKSRVYE